MIDACNLYIYELQSLHPTFIPTRIADTYGGEIHHIVSSSKLKQKIVVHFNFIIFLRLFM